MTPRWINISHFNKVCDRSITAHGYIQKLARYNLSYHNSIVKYGTRLELRNILHIDLNECIVIAELAVSGKIPSYTVVSLKNWISTLEVLREIKRLDVLYDGKIPNTSDTFAFEDKLTVGKVLKRIFYFNDMNEKKEKQKNFVKKFNEKAFI